MKCGCNLIGGETAEHPGIGLPPGYFDLAAFCIGFEEHTSGYPVSMDMDVLGWSSYGLGTNGYSLVRDIYDIHSRSELEQYYVELKQTLGESLLKPLAIYIRNVKDLEWCIEFSAHAHITGGGLLENIPRILPDDCAVEIDLRTWERPPIFKLIQEKGNLADEEMFRVFNQGLQMVSIVSVSKYIRDNMPGYIQRIGRVIRRPSSGAQVIFKGSFQ
ncbi:MAG: hypothetical protein HYV54_00865 [Parcubacteria group bacterium]|nr:hypothetical protein [Parcubacteria group bacterium]